MSDVFDVETLTVEQNDEVAFTTSLESVVVSVDAEVETVTISQPEVVESATVEVPGMQGAPGLQNVYAQPNNPADEHGWGMEQKGYIWIEVNV